MLHMVQCRHTRQCHLRCCLSSCCCLLQAANIIADFFDKCSKDPGYWQRISKGGLERIYSR
jgi:hypothetical protein